MKTNTETLVQDLRERGELDLSECFIDGMFIVAKKGRCVGKTKRGKGTKLMAISDSSGFPFALHATSASPHEVTLVLDTLEQSLVEERPEHLIGDKAYNSDKLDEQLAGQDIEMIAPHRKNRKPENKTQNGRPLRRYKRRWKVERLFAYLQNFRRILQRVLTRFDFYPENYLGFVHLACIKILLKCYL